MLCARSGSGPQQAGPDPDSFLQAQREAAFIKLLAKAVAAYLTAGDDEMETDEPEVLFEDHSACSNFSFDQADSLDFEQEEGS